MFSVVTKYHKGRHSLFLYNSEIFYAFTQDILRSHINVAMFKHITNAHTNVGKSMVQLQAALSGLQDGDLITDDDTIDKLNKLGEI